MTSSGLSDSMVTVMGPRGDSPSGSQKETCLTVATCLFRQNMILSPVVPARRTRLAASGILSRLISSRNSPNASIPLPLPTRWTLLPRSSTTMDRAGNMLRTAALTFSRSSVGWTSTSTVTSTLSAVGSEKAPHPRLELPRCTLIR